jgi:hypothetical protein
MTTTTEVLAVRPARPERRAAFSAFCARFKEPRRARNPLMDYRAKAELGRETGARV